MTGPYDDIINLPHPTSAKHPRMPLSDRAAQFAPFAALSGHSAALVETARLTDQRMELDEDARAALDSKQQLLLERIKERPEITVTWFQPDAKKDGGRYIVSTGRLKRIHEADQVLILVDGLRIRIRKAFSCRRTPATILQRKKAGTLLARSRRSACPAIKSALMTLLS